ncbi:MAG: Hsp70 family protein [Deltaproteobacteria bacterium]
MSARFSVGIDLGTTHCALAEAPLEGELESPRIQPILQLTARDRVDQAALLPSFLYYPHSAEGALALPWNAESPLAVGQYARRRAAESPGRVVASSKSWLSHPSVDRHVPVLPLNAAEDVTLVSPVEAAFRLLEHLSEAWRAGRTDGASLGDQEVVLTVPASFDAAARECTVEAALAAGLDQLTLLEEPQAAFYAWLDQRGDAWRSDLSVGDLVLVVDVGGGTSDFAAILLGEQDGSLEPRRVAVGQHLLLGGDNMDLALAHLVRQKLEAQGSAIDAWQLAALTHAAREAKEALLSRGAPDSVSVVLPSRGAQLLGGTLRSSLSREEVERYVIEGFFPAVPWQQEPRQRARTALRQRGLPYAEDPAITTQLAAFLRGHHAVRREAVRGEAARGERSQGLLVPSHVLFNGGVFRSEQLRQRLLDTLNAWLAAVGALPARALPNADYDLAVARGASYYGLVRRGRGIRVRGGTAQAFYVGIESSMPAVPGMDPPTDALCVAPFGMEEGSRVQLPQVELGVVVGESVTFRFFGSSTRRDDVAGTLLQSPERQLEELAPIAITLPAQSRSPGELVAVTLEAVITEVGTLALFARPLEPRVTDEHWKVELSVRKGGVTS